MPDLKDQIRCSGCRKVLAIGTMTDGKIEIKCKCGVVNTISAVPKKKEPSKNFIYNAPYQDRLNLTKK